MFTVILQNLGNGFACIKVYGVAGWAISGQYLGSRWFRSDPMYVRSTAFVCGVKTEFSTANRNFMNKLNN
jgi:hypothetical protein